MASNKKFETFDDATETWSAYQERLDMYFEASDVKAEKRKAVLLSSCGKEAYKLIRGLVAPQKPSEKTFEELCALFAKHYDPTPSEVVASYRFGTRHRLEGESVSSFVAELQRLSQHCGYGAMLPRMLRDQLVVGINNGRIQSRLLEGKDLTFEKARELAVALETATRDLDEIRESKETPLRLKAEKEDDVFLVKESCPLWQTKPLVNQLLLEDGGMSQVWGNRTHFASVPQQQACVSEGGGHQTQVRQKAQEVPEGTQS